MFRTLAATGALAGALLASVGAAHAQDRIVVLTGGKSPRMVKAELVRAAYTVCADSPDPLEWQTVDECTDASLTKALQQFRHLQRSRSPKPQSVATR